MINFTEAGSEPGSWVSWWRPVRSPAPARTPTEGGRQAGRFRGKSCHLCLSPRGLWERRYKPTLPLGVFTSGFTPNRDSLAGRVCWTHTSSRSQRGSPNAPASRPLGLGAHLEPRWQGKAAEVEPISGGTRSITLKQRVQKFQPPFGGERTCSFL